MTRLNKDFDQPSGKGSQTPAPSRLLIWLLAISFWTTLPIGTSNANQHPLRPPDVSSPRATLTSLLDNLDRAYALASDTDQPASRTSVLLRRAMRTLNLSEEPAGFKEAIGIEAALHLKEIIDRVGLPALDQIPDKTALEPDSGSGLTSKLLSFSIPAAGNDSTKRPIKWRLPNTEIVIARVADGPKSGEWLFTPETVARAAEFHDRVRDLPYLDSATVGIYEAYSLTPGPGLDLSWQQRLPQWLSHYLLEQTLWQWLSGGAVLAIAFSLALAAYRLGRRADKRRAATPPSRRGTILALLVMIAISVAAQLTLDQVINLTGNVLIVVKQFFIVVTHALIGWVTVLLLTQAPELMIRSSQLRPRGIDSQLLRLGFKLLALIALAILVVDGADRLGLPAYSVITGLGVGGLAVALAARETLANLLGSLSIMIDRPFRIGDWVKIGQDEGTVEDIGFRSTRIRTFYDSLLSIPNAITMNAVIDNMGQRTYRRVYTRLNLRQNTPPARIEAFIEGTKDIIREHSATRKTDYHVVLNDFGSYSLEIMLYFFLQAPDWSTELLERQRVLIDILHLADQLDIDFALPAQTIAIEKVPDDLRATGGEDRSSVAAGIDVIERHPAGNTRQ